MMKSRPHDDAMTELYRSDLTFALDVINSILEDGDQAELLVVLRQMAQAFGGVPAVAQQAHLNPTQLYRTLSPKGNPAPSSLSAILKAMGLRLAVQPLPQGERRSKRMRIGTVCGGFFDSAPGHHFSFSNDPKLAKSPCKSRT